MPLRVLVLTQGYPRHEDDHHATFVRDHARALMSAGLDVTVLCPSGPGLAESERDEHGVRIVRFRYAPQRLESLAYSGAMHRHARGWRLLLLPGFLFGFVAGALREGRSADVLHGHWWIPSGMVAVVAGRLVGKPAVVHVHGTDAAVARGPLRTVASWVLRHASAVLAVSRDLALWSGPRAVVAPMPLPSWVPSPTPAPSTGPVLGVGRLVPEKGFDLLIRASAAARRPVVLVGDGDQRSQLQALAAHTGASVEFRGALPGRALADEYQRCIAVVVPSRREGFGMVAAEGSAAARTVIAADVGGLRDIVRPGENGVLVPPDDVDALAHALQTLDPQLGARGPALVRSLRPDAVAARELALYESLPARSALLRPLMRVAGGAFAAVALVFCLLTIGSRWGDARSADLDWSLSAVALAVLAIAAADLVMAWAWGWLLRRLGEPAPWQVAMRVWWTGQLGRWLPTGLGSIPARVAAGAAAGLRTRAVMRATATEPAAAVVACFLLSALLLDGPLRVLAFAAALLTGAVAVRRWPPQVGFLALQIGQTAMRGVGFWTLLGVSTDARPSLPLVIGAVGLAYALGFLAVFAPGGIGVREAVLAATLSGQVQPEAVAAAAIAWRLLEVGVELPLTGWSRLLRQPRPAPGTLEATAP